MQYASLEAREHPWKRRDCWAMTMKIAAKLVSKV